MNPSGWDIDLVLEDRLDRVDDRSLWLGRWSRFFFVFPPTLSVVLVMLPTATATCQVLARCLVQDPRVNPSACLVGQIV